MPVLNLYYRPQYYAFLFVCTFYSFYFQMNCLLFVHLLYSEYLGNLPKFKGVFVRRLGRLHMLSPGQGVESSQPGQEGPPWVDTEEREHKCSLVQAVPPIGVPKLQWVSPGKSDTLHSHSQLLFFLHKSLEMLIVWELNSWSLLIRRATKCESSTHGKIVRWP